MLQGFLGACALLFTALAWGCWQTAGEAKILDGVQGRAPGAADPAIARLWGWVFAFLALGAAYWIGRLT